MDYDAIRLKTEGDVAILTLNRPERLNAATPQMFDEIGHAISNLGNARALVLTGEGRGFCAGADLVQRAGQSLPPGELGYKTLTESYNPVLLKISQLPLPVISAVNGPAVGIGCSLALAADVVLMAESAFLLEAFINVGLAGDGGAAWTLSRLVGKARATRMLMLAERISARTAEDWGLVYRCVANEILLQETMALANKLAAGPTRSLGLVRRSIGDAFEVDYATALEREADVRHSLGDSPDTLEGGRAFLEKRKPEFIGR
jgi:2-(1,2-epoxy-1,2-dihydrophenyl)acetyl-CoA isomerase